MLDHVNQVGHLREERVVITKAVRLLVVVTRAANVESRDLVGIDEPARQINVCVKLISTYRTSFDNHPSKPQARSYS